MTISEGLDSLKLEGCASVNDGVEKIEFAKAFESHLERNFQLRSRITQAQLSFIYFLVEETAKLVVNVEDTSHHIVRDSTELVLIQTTDRCSYLNWHKWASMK